MLYSKLIVPKNQNHGLLILFFTLIFITVSFLIFWPVNYISFSTTTHNLLNIFNSSTFSTTEPSENITELSVEDYSQLMNLQNFEFIKLSACSAFEKPPQLLIAIPSAPENFMNRQVIRETWGQPRPGLKVVFMLGLTKNETEIRLQQEHDKYKDLVQGNFIDAYKNLTYKHVMVLKFAAYLCPNAKYILKSDDDVFVNIMNVMRYIREIENIHVNKLLLCSPMYNSPILRDKGNKWYVSYEELPGKVYPPYCSGFVIFMTPDTVLSLYFQAQKTKYFWVDDVVVTGVAREKTDIQITPIPSQLFLNRPELNTLFRINNSFPNIKYAFFIGPMNINIVNIKALWKLILQRKVSN